MDKAPCASFTSTGDPTCALRKVKKTVFVYVWLWNTMLCFEVVRKPRLQNDLLGAYTFTLFGIFFKRHMRKFRNMYCGYDVIMK